MKTEVSTIACVVSLNVLEFEMEKTWLGSVDICKKVFCYQCVI